MKAAVACHEQLMAATMKQHGGYIFKSAQDAYPLVIVLQHLALLGALRGQLHNASRLVGYVNVQYQEGGFEREPTEKWEYEKLMAALREHLSEPEIEKLAAEGAAWSEDQAVEEALKV